MIRGYFSEAGREVRYAPGRKPIDTGKRVSLVGNCLRAAVAELRADAVRDGRPMDHLSDAEVLEGIQHAMTMLPVSTIAVVNERGLTAVARVLARFVRSATSRKH